MVAVASAAGAGWAEQPGPCWLVTPATAPVSTVIRSSSAAAAVRAMAAGPCSAAGCAMTGRLRPQLLPALAGSMSHTAQPPAAGTTVTARLAVVVLVPLAEVTVCRTPTVTVTDPGVRSRMAAEVTVAVAACRAAARWARMPGVPAASARAGYREAAAIGRSVASQAAGGCRQDQESHASVNRAARAAAACSRAREKGSAGAAVGTAAGRELGGAVGLAARLEAGGLAAVR